jgi:hypothetical protein
LVAKGFEQHERVVEQALEIAPSARKRARNCRGGALGLQGQKRLTGGP